MSNKNTKGRTGSLNDDFKNDLHSDPTDSQNSDSSHDQRDLKNKKNNSKN